MKFQDRWWRWNSCLKPGTYVRSALLRRLLSWVSKFCKWGKDWTGTKSKLRTLRQSPTQTSPQFGRCSLLLNKNWTGNWPQMNWLKSSCNTSNDNWHQSKTSSPNSICWPNSAIPPSPNSSTNAQISSSNSSPPSQNICDWLNICTNTSTPMNISSHLLLTLSPKPTLSPLSTPLPFKTHDLI